MAEPIFGPNDNPNPVMRFDCEGRIVYKNQAALAIVKFWCLDGSLGMLPDSPLCILRKAVDSASAGYLDVLLDNDQYRLQFVPFPKKNYVDVYGFNISECAGSEKPQHDAEQLTLTLDRRALLEHLEECYRSVKTNKNLGALVVVQILELPQLNQKLGRDSTDDLLQSIAVRMSTDIPASCFSGRLSGRQFLVVQRNLSTPTGAEDLGRLVANVFLAPFMVDGQEIYVSYHMGIVVFPGAEKNTMDLITHGELALDQISRKKNNQIKFYRRSMSTSVSDRHQLLEDLHHSLENNQLIVYFQPQVRLSDHAIVGAEALVRWQHPKHGLLTPGRFTALAEENGLIIPMGEWVLKQACMQMKRWHTMGFQDLSLAVNVSPMEFQNSRLVAQVERVIDGMGMAPESLELEITESVLIDDIDAAVAMFNSLKALGVKIAIDDFGTGFSSLSYLSRIPVDKIKIDKSFIEQISSNQESRPAMIDLIIDIGQKLSMQVLAEGIENEAQIEYLRRLGCDEVQGFYFSEALEASPFQELLSIGFSR